MGPEVNPDEGVPINSPCDNGVVHDADTGNPNPNPATVAVALNSNDMNNLALSWHHRVIATLSSTEQQQPNWSNGFDVATDNAVVVELSGRALTVGTERQELPHPGISKGFGVAADQAAVAEISDTIRTLRVGTPAPEDILTTAVASNGLDTIDASAINNNRNRM